MLKEGKGVLFGLFVTLSIAVSLGLAVGFIIIDLLPNCLPSIIVISLFIGGFVVGHYVKGDVKGGVCGLFSGILFWSFIFLFLAQLDGLTAIYQIFVQIPPEQQPSVRVSMFTFVLCIVPLIVVLLAIPSFLGGVLGGVISLPKRDYTPLIYAMLSVAMVLSIVLGILISVGQVETSLSIWFLLFLLISMVLLIVIEIALVRFNFSVSEMVRIYKTMALFILPIVLACILIYYLIGDLEKLGAFYSLWMVGIGFAAFHFFLIACICGMAINVLVARIIVFALKILNKLLGLWHYLQLEPPPKPFIYPKNITIEDIDLKRNVLYHFFEFFIASLWLMVVLSSSLSDFYMWFEQKAIFLLIVVAISPLMCLSFLTEKLKITWNTRVISPKILHKVWSIFALIGFIT